MNFKLPHLVLAACALAITVCTWVLAENAAGDFTLPAKVIAGVASALTVLKLVVGLLSPSAKAAINASAASAASKVSVCLFMAILAVSVLGCQSASSVPPQTGAIINGGLVTLACGWGVYTQDTATSPPATWVQIALDLAAKCGMDVADIVAQFGADHPVAQAATANAGQIHTASMAFRAKQAH